MIENESYQTVDFLYGSSGSPVFSSTGDLVIMHRGGVLLNLEDPNCQISLLEQGMSIERIIDDAYSRNDRHVKKILEDLFPGKFQMNNDIKPMDVHDT